MRRETIDDIGTSLRKKPGIHDFRIEPISPNLSRRFLKVVIRSVIEPHKNPNDAPLCIEPGCKQSGLFTLSEDPDRLISHDERSIQLPNFDNVAIELKKHGFSLDEIRELMAYRKQITVCLEHYKEHLKLWEERREGENQ